MYRDIADPLAEFNRLYKKMDEVYHHYAKGLGLSDMALWLLYSLYESGGPCTQRAFCAAWHHPPQTVNSALKKLEAEGLIERRPMPGNRKNKQIALTQRGEAYMESTIAPLMRAEQRAFRGMEGLSLIHIYSLSQILICNLSFIFS